MAFRRAAALLVTFATAAVACTGSTTPSPTGNQGGATFAAGVGSTDLWAGAPQLFELGISESTQAGGVQLVTFGTIQLAFSYLGTDGSAPPTAGPSIQAAYLPAPTTAASGSGPSLSSPDKARGVYAVEGVVFDKAGIWTVAVSADVHGAGTQNLTATFAVSSKPLLPAPGQKALKTDNLTLSSKGAPPSAIDSRALNGNPVPDPDLHRWTIAKAIDEHRPILVIFATPTYCQSQFCGPSVDGVEALAKTYAKRAVFIHVEIWRDYQKSVVNKAAADWLFRKGDLTEPWLYLIGSNGIIKDRWGPLFDPAEVAKDLAALPPMKG